ncbi:threonine ammonia-lyase [Sphingomonas sp. ERG5]|uniref:threonine ammonia-lyase n=1 Tax=Sphingomonas sp. ERG5 TaxID=1381597 RepID=UPI00068A5192|nr:pyridoxal-phosphate dependent enzyme [Sphingomonas sp. ERG5]
MEHPTSAGIIAALDTIDRVFLSTPLRRSPALDAVLGATLILKDETANPIRSFKGRGTSHFAARLAQEARPAGGLVCGSAGNFGQGLAWAAGRHDLALTVYAAINAVTTKIDAMRRLGADVRLAGKDFDAAKEAAQACAQREGRLLVEDGADRWIAEGAGTLALEVTRNAGPIDAIIVPLGNGALASGVGTWIKHATPQTRVVAVAATGAPAMADAVLGRVSTGTHRADTIADGIAVRVPIPYAVDCVRAVVDDIVFVDDDAIRQAMDLLREHLDLIVEPAGAAGLAALIADPTRWRGQRVAVPLCGGNVDHA